MRVQTGAEQLLARPELIPGARLGLLTNYTAVTPDLVPLWIGWHRVDPRLQVLFGPEHGLWGSAQAGEAESDQVEPVTGLPVVDTYGQEESRWAAEMAGLDGVVIDLQDVGSRCYTYVWSALRFLRAASRRGVPVYVLDRPNPLAGVVAGPGLQADCVSLVGELGVPLRHGLTLGELLREAAAWFDLPEPSVIAMKGWRRDKFWAETGLPWVPPSPNLPTPASALVYPGTVLLEGSNLSEGRGTTLPFELVGAPWLTEEWAWALRQRDLPGVQFRLARFQPTGHKYAGQVLTGVQLHVLDPDRFDPIQAGLALLETAKEQVPEHFAWREPDWEGASRPFVDLLWGSPVLREQLGTGVDLLEASPTPIRPVTAPLYR